MEVADLGRLGHISLGIVAGVVQMANDIFQRFFDMLDLLTGDVVKLEGRDHFANTVGNLGRQGGHIVGHIGTAGMERAKRTQVLSGFGDDPADILALARLDAGDAFKGVGDDPAERVLFSENPCRLFLDGNRQPLNILGEGIESCSPFAEPCAFNLDGGAEHVEVLDDLPESFQRGVNPVDQFEYRPERLGQLLGLAVGLAKIGGNSVENCGKRLHVAAELVTEDVLGHAAGHSLDIARAAVKLVEPRAYGKKLFFGRAGDLLQPIASIRKARLPDL